MKKQGDGGNDDQAGGIVVSQYVWRDGLRSEHVGEWGGDRDNLFVGTEVVDGGDGGAPGPKDGITVGMLFVLSFG